MSRRKIKAGSTSVMLPIFVQDSTATDGSGLGALVYNTASLAARYRRAGASSWTTITLVTATLGTFTSGGFITSGGVTGSYEVGIPNAAIAAGAPWVEIEYYGAANMLPVKIEIELDAVDYQDATAFGLANLNAAVGSRSSHSAADVWAVATRTLSEFGFSVPVSDKTGFKLASDGLPTMPTDWISAAGLSAAAVGKIEGALLNDGDGTALVTALIAAFDAADIDMDIMPALVGAWILNRVLAGNHDTAGTPGKILQDILGKTVNLPADPASATDVTAAKDAVLTAVGTPLQAGDYVEPDNAGIGDAVTAAGAAATAAGAAQTAAETAATAAAAAATESEVQAIIDTIKGAGWTTETLKAIFDKPGAALTPEQVTEIAGSVVEQLAADGVTVSLFTAEAILQLAAKRAFFLLSPLLTDGSYQIVQGQDCFAVDGRSLDLPNPKGDWPNLTGATIKVTCSRDDDDASPITFDGSVVTPTGTGQKVRGEPDSALTAQLSIGDWTLDFEAILATSGHIVPLGQFPLNVKRRNRPL